MNHPKNALSEFMLESKSVFQSIDLARGGVIPGVLPSAPMQLFPESAQVMASIRDILYGGEGGIRTLDGAINPILP